MRRRFLYSKSFEDDSLYYHRQTASYYNFSLYNTPIENFCSQDAGSSNFIINDIAVRKVDLYELLFGKSYSNISITLPNYFLYNTSITLVNIANLSNVPHFGYGFMANNRSLYEFNIGSIDFSVVNPGVASFINIPPSGVIKANSNQLGQNLKDRVPEFSNWQIVVNG